MRWKLVIFLITGVLVVSATLYYINLRTNLLIPGELLPAPSQQLPYNRLTFEQLAKRSVEPSLLEIGEKINTESSFESYKFYYLTEGKKVSGQINLPTDRQSSSLTPKNNKLPVVVMARGYVPKDGYVTGLGTKNAAAVYAANGYITLAPDFLGYGESDLEDTDSIGARLYRPVEVLDLLSALTSLTQADLSQVYLWGHSNGGQIMLSVAEILGMRDTEPVSIRGMMLWAPVSKPFPYSILAFSDEGDDQGKAMRRALYVFETSYDVFNYSIDLYFEFIDIPIVLHQGTADDAVPYWWSDSLAEKLEELEKDVTYYKYPGADHNMRPVWDMVVKRDLKFINDLR